MNSGYLDPKIVAGFAVDTGCLNKEVIEGIDYILANDKSDPIIIIQSDHGSPLLEPEPTKNNLVAFAILNVMRFPPGCGQRFYDSISTINTFRLVFSCLENEPLPLLPDRHFDQLGKVSILTEVQLRQREPNISK
jgi:hypothetical protein